MDQHNENGPNIAENNGEINITYNGTKEDDWLQPYDPNDDVLISYYIDGRWVGKIENKLSNKKVCLIKATEGRGKTCLSRIIAKKFSEEGYKVWFGDITRPEASGESLKQWCKVKNTNCLIILENLHSCKTNEELECLVKSIELMKKPQWHDNGNNELLFLLNTRPTSEDFDTIMSDLGKEVIEELEPDIEYCKGVARLSKRPIEENDLDSFLKNKRLGFGQGNANLRLLGIILEIWNMDEALSSILNINEKKIILRFKTKYELDSLKETDKGYLMFLSSIFQFDIPLPRELLKPEEIDFLNALCNDKHLVIDKDYKFYLPHSVDASYLSKAIGGRQYKTQTQDKILDFVNRILVYQTPRAFEGDFKLLISGLREKNTEYEEAIKALTRWDLAEQIIQKINPAFIITAFDTKYTNAEKVKEIYNKNKKLLKEIILDQPPIIQNNLVLIFNKYLNIEKVFVNDIFVSLNELNAYLDKYTPFRSAWIKVWRELWEKKEFREILEERVPAGGFSGIQYDYGFNTTHDSIFQCCLSNETIRSFYVLNVEQAENQLSKINKYGFYFKNCSWTHLSKMIASIRAKTNDENKIICGKVIKRIVQTIINEINADPLAVQKASLEQLSFFLYNIKLVDEKLYNHTVSNIVLINEVKSRLKAPSIGMEELFLFANYYQHQGFDSFDIHGMVENAKLVFDGSEDIIEENERKISVYLDRILRINPEYFNLLIEDEGLIAALKQRLDTMHTITYEGLYLFSKFFHLDWCKEKIVELINNADEEQKAVIAEWHDKVMVSIEDRGEEIIQGGLLEYIHNKPYCQ